MRNSNVRNLVLAATFLGIGLVLPLLTGNIPEIGSKLLPMHIPVFLCALICGYKYGALVGFILPLLRFAIFKTPPIYPVAIAMTFELMTYGLVAGIVYEKLKKNMVSVYIALFTAMLAGRAVWGIAMTILLGLKGNAFSFGAFTAGAFIESFPGIILQLVLIPLLMITLDATGLLRFDKNNKKI